MGHGIGRQMHEEPQVPIFFSRSLRGSGDFNIEPGLVIAVEPMVNMGTKRVKMHRIIGHSPRSTAASGPISSIHCGNQIRPRSSWSPSRRRPRSPACLGTLRPPPRERHWPLKNRQKANQFEPQDGTFCRRTSRVLESPKSALEHGYWLAVYSSVYPISAARTRASARLYLRPP